MMIFSVKNEQNEALVFDTKALEYDVANLQTIIEDTARVQAARNIVDKPKVTANVGTNTYDIGEVNDDAGDVIIASDVGPPAGARRRSNTPPIIPVETPPPSRRRGGTRGRPAEEVQETASVQHFSLARLEANTKAMETYQSEINKKFEEELRAGVDWRVQQLNYNWCNTQDTGDFYAGVGKDLPGAEEYV